MPRLMLLIVAAGLLVVPAQAGVSTANGEIAFLRPPLDPNQTPYRRLFVVNADGSGVRDITPAGYSDIRSFSFSPDGRLVAFSAVQAGDLDPEIFVMPADGGPVRRLTDNNLTDDEPSWSPDGRSLAFTSIRGLGAGIYRMRADGTDQRRLTDPYVDCEAPAWSPRGGLIAFRYGVHSSDSLAVIRPNGTHLHVILGRAKTSEGIPSWSPDGRTIAFGRGTGPASWQSLGIWTIHPNGTGLHRLTTAGGIPAYSPDGRWIAFVGGTQAHPELYRIAATGRGTAVQLTHTDGISEARPGWRRAP